jgi:DNA-binding SARP family transcriptional activator
VDEFRLLGPLEAVVDGKPMHLAAAKPRALLALLLLNRNQVVSIDRLIDELWDDNPPVTATKTLQVYVSQLRKELGPDRLVTRPPGYLLRVEEGELDLERFEQLTADARKRLADGDPGAARDELLEALRLWRGPAESAAARLEELRLSAYEDSLHARLESGEAAGLIPELEELVETHPLREHPRELLMLALYRSGRQADALELFRRTRTLFVDELGIEPGPGLRDLEQAMLRQDSELRLPVPRREQPAPSPRRRRVWIAVVAAGLLVAAGVIAGVLASSGGGNSKQQTTAQGSPQLRSFVYKLENFLLQSHDGRVQVTSVLAGAFDCSLQPDVAAAQLDGVQENRQSLLEQLAALQVPENETALRSADLLQQASHASIAADWIYRDWLRTRTDCVRGSKPPAGAARADARATRLKRRFLVVFDPLARRFGRRVWRADEF